MRDRCFSASIFFCMSLTPVFLIFPCLDFGTGVGEMVLVGVGCSCGGEVQRMV